MILTNILRFLNEIKNGYMAKKDYIIFQGVFSKSLYNISKILTQQDRIKSFEIIEVKTKKNFIIKHIKVNLLYVLDDKLNKIGFIKNIEHVSVPSRKVIIKAKDIPLVMNGKGFCIINTNLGLIDGKTAKKHNVGGTLLVKCY